MNPAAIRESKARVAKDFKTTLDGLAREWGALGEAKQDFLSFMLMVGRDKRGHRLRVDSYTRFMASLYPLCFDQDLNISRVSPPGLGKSTQARLFLIHRLGRNINSSIVITSAEETVAENGVALCRDIVIGVPYRAIFPWVIPDFERSKVSGKGRGQRRGWMKGKFFIETQGQSPDPSMESVAAIPTGEARRVDILYADDIMTRRVAESSDMRDKMINSFFLTWVEGRLIGSGEDRKDGFCMCDQNCWHTDDLAHILRGYQGFCSVWVGITDSLDRWFVRLWNPPKGLPVIDDPSILDAEFVTPTGLGRERPDVEFTMPLPGDKTLYDLETIMARSEASETLRERVNVDTFARLWQLKAPSASDKMFPQWFKKDCRDQEVWEFLGIGDEKGLPFVRDDLQFKFTFSLGIDLSDSDRAGDALCTLVRLGNGDIFPVEYHQGRFEVSEIVELIDDAWRRGIRYRIIMVENNGVQGKIAKAIAAMSKEKKYEWPNKVDEFTTGKNKSDPNLGLPVLNVEFGNGTIIWPGKEVKRKDASHSADWRMLEAGFKDCPRFPGRTTPDGVMSFWFARAGLEKCGLRRGGKSSNIGKVGDLRDNGSVRSRF